MSWTTKTPKHIVPAYNLPRGRAAEVAEAAQVAEAVEVSLAATVVAAAGPVVNHNGEADVEYIEGAMSL